MSPLMNDPAAFADELTDGFVAAHARYVQRVPGGVVRRAPSPHRQVAVVIGGGAGHYPAFAGLVGQGLAHGAAMGGIFASPSADQVYSVARMAERDAGVLLVYGNYAGDVLNFDQAQERLIAEGIPCQTVVVTDDISSAPPDEMHRRRGVAGALVVVKCAAAAAESGYTLADVARVAADANARARTIGVAFSGCWLPGASEPLFEVTPGRMAIGMGIHGEPGLSEAAVPSAAELAKLLVSQLVPERPGVADGCDRVVVLLNGLGTVKYEEMFVVFKDVARQLDAAGLCPIEPEVGEFVTSLDMAGMSLSLVWLTEELEDLWRAPAAAPGFRKATSSAPDLVTRTSTPRSTPSQDLPAASAASHESARIVLRLLQAAVAAIDQNVETLGRLDAVAGDGDHGIGMQRGARAGIAAATAAFEVGGGVQSVLQSAGDAWAARAGGTSGALWGAALGSLAAVLGNEETPLATDVAAGVRAAKDRVIGLGKAEVGDKTMVDALAPFSDVLSIRADAGSPLREAWSAAAQAAREAADATADLLPRTGRARAHGQRSLGSPDPGAQSFALIVEAVADGLGV